MNNLGLWLIASSLPVTLFALTGIVVYILARRGSPTMGALTAATTLFLLTGVSFLAVSSWPRWWTLTMPIASTISDASNIVSDISMTEHSTVAITTVESSSPAELKLPIDTTALATPATDSTIRPPAIVTPSLGTALDSARAKASLPPPRSTAWTWTAIAGLTFAVGVSLAMIRFLLGLWMVHRYRVSSTPITDPVLIEQVRRIARDLNIDRPIALRQSRIVTTPATIGWRSPLVLLPAGWKSWNDGERRVVLVHEIAHIARGDYLTWLLAQLTLALHFYHPLVHWLTRRLRLEQELAADGLAAELAGGREFYLVTLTKMVLRRDARRTSWAAQPFFPHHGTFLRRIEMLSSKPSITAMPWSRAAVATLVAAMAFLGLTIAGIRVTLAEPPAPTQAKDRPATTIDEKPATAATRADKPLTLDELRTLVIKQIRSIRSLHVIYTKTDPQEFGGKSTGHIWAEQGSKMLRRDISGGPPAKYSVSFDGKQTYRVLYLDGRPAGREIGDEYAPEVFNSLHTSLLGWMHPRDNRKSLLEAILAPTAKIVDHGTAEGSVGPTIEVQNYSEPGSKYDLDLRIVLDRDHGYFPRSFAFHAVTTPTWQFAYEMDEFAKVRDPATGENRWFPSKGRYKQKTPEHGEQIFKTIIDKVRINETLPDDTFVLPGDALPPAPDDEPQALDEFQQLYHLDNADQIIKLIRPPFVAGRMVHLRAAYPSIFATGNYDDGGAKFPSLVYLERDGKIMAPGFHATGSFFFDLRDMLPHFVRAFHFDDPDKLLHGPIVGDFIVRADIPPNKILDALGKIVAKEFNIPVKLELKDKGQPIVLIRGEIKPPFVFNQDNVLEISATSPPSDEGSIRTGTFSDFTSALEQYLEPGRRVVSEIENPPQFREKISWRLSPRGKADNVPLEPSEARVVLEQLERQTGLKFILDERKYPTIIVRKIE